MRGRLCMKIATAVVAVVGMLVLVMPSAAQDRHGTVEGRVVDTEGIAIPGASVELSGPNMMGLKRAVTGPDGEFRIILVPPGEYDLEVSLSGFQTVTREALPVSLGLASQVEVILQRAEFGQAIEVRADQILIDTTSSQVGANIGSDFVASLPTDRNYQTVMKMLPSVVHSNNPIFKGASGADNMYLVDGADSTDPATNTWAVTVNFDNLQEIQMIDGGVPAEYGKGTGAVVNLVTKSGSNELHGIARFTYSDEDLNAEQRGERYYFDEPERYVSEERPAFNLGGPLLKNQLWFFISYEERDKQKSIARYHTFEDAAANRYSNDSTSYSGHYATGKLTYQPTINHSFFAQYIEDPITIPNKDGYDGYQNRAPEAERRREQGGESYIIDWTGVLTDTIFINLQYSGKRKRLDTLAVDTEGPIYYSPVNGGIYWGSSYSDYYSSRDLDLYKATYDHFIDTDAGSHELKIGVELSHGMIGYEYDIYPSNEYINLRGDGSPNYRRLYTQRRGPINTERDTWTIFVQDRWQLSSRLTLNIGLRFEQYVHDNNQGTPILDWGFGDRFAPRLGVAYAIGEGNLHASIGRYHDTIGYELARDLSVYPDEIYDQYDWDSAANAWAYSRTYVLGADYITMDKNLKSPYMDELVVGYEGKISSSMKWGVDATMREWKDGVEGDDGSDFPDNPAADGNVHYLNLDKVRKYKGIELKLVKLLSDNNLQLMASYNYSKTTGIWANDDEDASWGGNPFRYYNQWGRVYQDRPHMLKLFGSYHLPWDFVIGSGFVYQSGAPYEHYARVRTSRDGIWGGSSFTSYLVDPRGARRLPSNWLLDLRLEKDFSLGPVVLGLYVDVFNLTNNQEALDIDDNIGTITLEGDLPGAAYTEIDSNGTFGEYTEWQAPRSYFFGVKVEF